MLIGSIVSSYIIHQSKNKNKPISLKSFLIPYLKNIRVTTTKLKDNQIRIGAQIAKKPTAC